jgi:tetratricopeptide (TPR) repeat protein
MARTVWVKAVTIVAASVVLLASAFGQGRGGGGTAGTSTGTGTTGAGTTGTTGTGGPTTTGRPTTNPNPTQPTPNVSIPQPIFISGRVVMEDGTGLSEPLVIETVCNGVGHSEGYTDAKGYFAIELGSNRGVIQDASEFSTSNTNPALSGIAGSSNPTFNSSVDSPERKYMGCDLQAKLAGYRSQAVPLAGRRPMDDPNIGTILLHRLGKQEESLTISAVSLGAPKDAKKAYEKGMDALKKKKFADAQNSFEKAVELYPKYALAWYELGRLRAAQDQFDIARGSFDEAIKADPKFVPPYLSISLLEMQAKRWQQLADVTEKTVQLDPFDYPQAYFFNSVANFNMRNLEAAEKSALQAERLDTRHQFPKLSHLLGLIMADRKDWAGAAQRFKDYLKLAPKAPDADAVRSQLAQVEKIQEQVASAKDQ